jgi:transposase
MRARSPATASRHRETRVAGAWSGWCRACALSQAHHSREASQFPSSANRCVIAMEACAGAYRWARGIAKLGHPCTLDRAGLGQAVHQALEERCRRCRGHLRVCASFRSRPKSSRRDGIVFRACDLLVRQRTQCVNALRGHLLEYGHLFPKGVTHVESLVALVEDLQSSQSLQCAYYPKAACR